MNWRISIWITTMFVTQTMLCLAADSTSLSDDTLTQIRFDQKLNSQVDLNLPFQDETGRAVKLGDYFGSKPVILTLGYYGCPMLCTLVLNGTVECLQDLKADIGDRFEMVYVSIDPHETPELAAKKKETYLTRYGRDGAESGWHFLTGNESAIRQLADEVGFHYAYDASVQQYAHPSGIIILTPGGKVSRYFFGVRFSPKEVSAALREAGGGRVNPSPVEQLLLLCFHYNPIKGKYGNLIMNTMRVAAAGTVVGIAAVVIISSRRRLRVTKGKR